VGDEIVQAPDDENGDRWGAIQLSS